MTYHLVAECATICCKFAGGLDPHGGHLRKNEYHGISSAGDVLPYYPALKLRQQREHIGTFIPATHEQLFGQFFRLDITQIAEYVIRWEIDSDRCQIIPFTGVPSPFRASRAATEWGRSSFAGCWQCRSMQDTSVKDTNQLLRLATHTVLVVAYIIHPFRHPIARKTISSSQP